MTLELFSLKQKLEEANRARVNAEDDKRYFQEISQNLASDLATANERTMDAHKTLENFLGQSRYGINVHPDHRTAQIPDITTPDPIQAQQAQARVVVKKQNRDVMTTLARGMNLASIE